MIYISNLRKISDGIVTTKINWFFVRFSSNFAGLIPMKIRNKLCLADSGQPLCIVIRALKLPQLKVSTLSGGQQTFTPSSSPDADRTLVGLMGPPFQLITLSDHLFFHSLFKIQILYNFYAQRTVATNLIVSSS